jgi:hypothetical protein
MSQQTRTPVPRLPFGGVSSRVRNPLVNEPSTAGTGTGLEDALVRPTDVAGGVNDAGSGTLDSSDAKSVPELRTRSAGWKATSCCRATTPAPPASLR